MNSELNILRNFLNYNGYRISDDLLEIQFVSHPDKSGLNSITDTLDYFNIEHVAAEISIENLDHLNNPFIAHIQVLNKEHFVLIQSITQIKVILFDGKTERTLSKEEFLNCWGGVVIIIDRNKDKFHFTANHLILAVMVLSFSIPVIMGLPVFSVLLYILSVSGIFFNVLIIQKELGFKNNLAQKFCGPAETSGCDELIKNRVKLLYEISLGDVCLVYFVLLTPLSLSSANYSLIKVMSFLTGPVVLFSLIYQFIVIKKWCRLCLAIVAILSLQLLTNVFLLNDSISFNNSFIIYVIAYLILISIWQILKRELAKAAELKEFKIEGLRFRRNYNLFLAYHNSQSAINTSLPYNTPEITFGNADAAIQMVVVSNPICQPCSKAHEIYERLLAQYPDKISLKVRFYVPLEDKNDPRTEIAARLLMLSQITSAPDEMRAILHKWYLEKRIDPSLNYLLKDTERKDLNAALKVHKNWCLANQINITPTMVINGKIFPGDYQIADVENFIDILVEQQVISIKKEYMGSYNI